jgi:putative ABC transport system permease protein
MSTLLQDIRYGIRMLARNPGFTVVAVLTLALGIGANTAIFTAANDFLLRPLPFGNSDRVVMVKRYFREFPEESGANDAPTFKFWREQNHVFEEVAGWGGRNDYFNLTGAEGPERVTANQVSEGFFRVLGLKPILGRTFSAAEGRAGGNRVAVISHALWQTRYGGNPGILGKTIILDGKEYSIIGVLPAGFRFSTIPEDVWTPLTEELDYGHGGEFLNVIALLKPGVTLTKAQADIVAITTPWARQFADWGNGDQWVAVESLRDRYTRDLRPALLALLVAAALVLLIACANLANLLLTRATRRYKEISIRRALGASRTRIIRQMLIESLVLVLLGGPAGLLLAFAGSRIFYAVLPAAWQPVARGGFDARVLAFTLVTLLLTVFLIGMAPAWSASGFDLNEGLKDGQRSLLAGMRRRSFRAALVVGEVALAASLLTSATLLIKSFARLSAVNLGFAAENVLTVDLARTRGGEDAFYKDVLERLSALPRVRAAGVIDFKPLYGGPTWGQDITIEGRPPRAPNDYIYAGHRSVSVGYFRVMGIPLLKGRTFVATDPERGVAMVSESMARRYWPGEDAVGKRFGVNCHEGGCHWNTVIGVVGDVREDGAIAEPATAMYFLETSSKMTLVVRATQNPTNLIADVRGVIRSVDRDQPIGNVRTMDNIVSESVAPRRLTMLIAGLLAALALLLAMVGLYGVISYSVAQRSHEFGIRMALGAERADILKLVVGQGSKLVLAGVGMGILGALALTRFVSSLLYGVRPTDTPTFLAVTLVLIGVALLASYIPARRATKVDPLVALRYE